MTTLRASTQPPVLDADPFSLETILNPYPFHARLRDIASVAYIPRYDTYAVGRYADVMTVQKDWQDFTSVGGSGMSDIRKPGAWREPGPIVESDPPHHTQIRSVLGKIISPKIIRSWQAQFDAAAVALADRLVGRGTVNGAKEIAETFVMEVFPASLGLKAHPENMVIVGDFNFNALGPQNALYQKSAAALAGIAEWFEAAQSRDFIAPDSFSDQVYRAEDAGALKPGEAKGLVRTMLRGGMDTTISGLGSALMLLSQRPEVWADFRASRTRLKLVFEEAIRLESPIQSYYRTTNHAVEIGDRRIPADAKVQIFVGSANRDPRRWTNPDDFDLSRPAAGHLAFGQGIHVCIGQLIARMEAESLLNALLDRFAAIEPVGTPVYRPLNTLRTLDGLPLRLVPA